MANGEFAVLQTLFTDIRNALNINLTVTNEHKPFIRCMIRVIKERVHAVCHTLPFKTLPCKMVANMALYLNFSLVKNGISKMLSPKVILSREQINYQHYKLLFGSYCQAHEDIAPSNSLAARTQGAIFLGSSGNLQGAQQFLNLKTGDVIVQHSYLVENA